MRKRLSSTPTRIVDIVDYLTERFTYYTRDQWIEQLQIGNLTVGGVVLTESRCVQPGEKIEFTVPVHEDYEPPVDTDWNLLYEDEHLFIVNKPGDLPIHPAGRYKENTLLSLIEKERPNEKFYTIHRLDRETSGVVLFAKNEFSATKLSKDFQMHRVYKQYLAWVYGKFPQVYSNHRGILQNDPRTVIRKKLVFESCPDGNVETTLRGIGYQNGISLVLAVPITGKTHQIRATLASIGYPLIGDKIYGLRDTAFLEFIEGGQTESLTRELGYHRQALHAFSIEFSHPQTGNRMDVVSPIPRLELSVDKNYIDRSI